jgi:hypothetical protein
LSQARRGTQSPRWPRWRTRVLMREWCQDSWIACHMHIDHAKGSRWTMRGARERAVAAKATPECSSICGGSCWTGRSCRRCSRSYRWWKCREYSSTDSGSRCRGFEGAASRRCCCTTRSCSCNPKMFALCQRGHPRWSPSPGRCAQSQNRMEHTSVTARCRRPCSWCQWHRGATLNEL